MKYFIMILICLTLSGCNDDASSGYYIGNPPYRNLAENENETVEEQYKLPVSSTIVKICGDTKIQKLHGGQFDGRFAIWNAYNGWQVIETDNIDSVCSLTEKSN